MKFKEINKNKITLKIEPTNDDNNPGFFTSALEAPRIGNDGKRPHPLKAFGRTREESLACWYRCVEDKDRFIEADVNLNEKCFEKNIFMGSWPYCQAEVQILHKKIDKAYWILCGLQQNGGQGTEFDYDSDKKGCEDIKAILDDITTALQSKPVQKPIDREKELQDIMHKVYVITEINGSYEDAESRNLFAVRSEAVAKEAIELLNKYAAWINDKFKKEQAFRNEWKENNPQTWTDEERRKFSYSFGGITDREDYKDYKNRLNKWHKNSVQAFINYKETVVVPEEFVKIDNKFGVSYNDDLRYTYIELDILENGRDLK